MTECPELRNSRRCLFIQDTTRRGRSSVQPLFLVGSHLHCRTARVSQERSKLMKSVLCLLHYNFFQQVDLKNSHEGWEVVQLRHLHLRHLCRQADSIRKTGKVIAAAEIMEISSWVSLFKYTIVISGSCIYLSP